MRGLLLTLCLSFGGRPAPQETIAVVHDAQIVEHAALADAFSRASSSRVVIVGPTQAWPESVPPNVVVAIGERAEAAARRRWKHRPRASLMMLDGEPSSFSGGDPSASPDATKSDAGVPRFWASAHTEPTCTAERLQASVPEGSRWVVVAGPRDDGATALADALEATLLRGTPSEVAQGLRAREVQRARVWIRGATEFAVPEWLTYLGQVAQISSARIGFDLPAARAFGLERWVEPDLERLANDAARWADTISRRRRPPPLTIHPVPCRTRSTSDHPHD